MIDRLTPYPAYKGSGVSWLGDVPDHWDVQRLRNTAEIRVSNVDKNTTDGESPIRLCNYVDVYKNDRIRETMPFMRATATSDEIDRFRLVVGDVLITKDSEMWNDIGVPALVESSADDLICGYHVALLRAMNGRTVGSYLFRAFQSTGVGYQLHVEANGVTRYGLSQGSIKSVWIPRPPLSEQTAIVKYLDYVDRRIRHLMRSKQQLIKLLDEQQLVLINGAVSWGHSVVALRYLATKFGSGVTPRGGSTVYEEEGIPFIRSQNVQFNGLHLDNVARITIELHTSLAVSHVRSGDVLLNITGASIGRACAVPNDFTDGNVNQHVCIIRPLQKQILPGYLAAVLSTPLVQHTIRSEANGASREGLTLESIRSLKIPLPCVEEQRSILEKIAESSFNVSVARHAASSEVLLLQEYRTRLLADVVTGKIDVREVEASLPDEISEEEIILDGMEPFVEDGLGDDESGLAASLQEVEV